MNRYVAFVMGEVYPADDPLSEWLVTLSLAMNDLALVHERLEEDQNELDRAFYWRRLAVSHFWEVALFLRDTAGIPEVKTFLGSLGDATRRNYDECLSVFNELRGKLNNTRNKAAFHYPQLKPCNAKLERPVREALTKLHGNRGIVRKGTIRDGRAFYADAVVYEIFAKEVGGADAVDEFNARVAAGVTAFMRFANLALDEHVDRAHERGARLDEVQPVDPADLGGAWKAL